MYKSRYVIEHDPIDESFSELPLEVQKEAAEGILYAQEKFGLKVLPYKIGAAKLIGKWGTYELNNDGYRTITINTDLADEKNKKEIFPTMVHEMAHFADALQGDFSEDIIKIATKNLGLRINSRETSILFSEITNKNYFDASSAKSCKEIFAYSIEKVASKKGNKMSLEIYKIFKEIMNG